MKNVLIVGYPKSGTTWISRLVAELIEAPVMGYWQSDHHDPAISNTERRAKYSCYKSHHPQSVLSKDSRLNYIIHVYRDPRSVCSSAMHYFRDVRWLKQSTFLAPLVNSFAKLFFRERVWRKKLIAAVLYGDENVNVNMALSWNSFIQAYLSDAGVLSISYEEMLNFPKETCLKILDYLDMNSELQNVEHAIASQSFEAMKSDYITNKNKGGQYLMRKGAADSWKTELNNTEIDLINKELKPVLMQLNYPLN